MCVSHGVCRPSVQVGLHGGDELALLLQRQVEVILLVTGDVLQHLVHQLVVRWEQRRELWSVIIHQNQLFWLFFPLSIDCVLSNSSLVLLYIFLTIIKSQVQTQTNMLVRLSLPSDFLSAALSCFLKQLLTVVLIKQTGENSAFVGDYFQRRRNPHLVLWTLTSAPFCLTLTSQFSGFTLYVGHFSPPPQ